MSLFTEGDSSDDGLAVPRSTNRSVDCGRRTGPLSCVRS